MLRNNRILIIDDSVELIDEMEKVLGGSETFSGLDDELLSLFSDNRQEKEHIDYRTKTIAYDITSFTSGQKGFEAVKRSLEENTPFATAFVDMRMPGWDGTKTVREIKNIDKNIEIVIITAFDEYQRQRLLSDIGTPDKILILKKPFSRDEIRQVALALTAKWNTEQTLKEKNLYLEETLSEKNEQIKERQRAEGTLRESEEKYRSAMEASPDPMVVYNLQGQVTYLNPAFTRVFGWTLDELIGRKIDFVPGEEWQATREAIDKVYAEGNIFSFESQRYTKGGEVLNVSINASIYRDHDGKVVGLVVNIRDITEKKKLEAQLRQAHKMEAIGILAGGVAHDFNNLLTSIQMNTEMAILKADESDPQYRYLKQIRTTVIRAADLARQLLIFSRKQPMQLTHLNINTLVEDLLKMLQRLIGEDITMKIELAPEPWTIKADAGNIEQVIMNLAVNSRDAMPDGGTLTIKCDNVTLDELYCRNIPEARPGRFVHLSVTDTGIGMNKETIQHIFEPFFSTKEAGKGTGLGLSVVHGIVKQHQGWINVYSEKGMGSVFSIYFPAVPGMSESVTEESVSLNDLQGGGERILLVEDEDEVRGATAMAMRENGYKIFEAANAREAEDIFAREKGCFDLVFTDVVMPDDSGLQLVDRLLEHDPQLKILFSSGYTDAKSQWTIIRDRGFRFLQKPYTLLELFLAVQEALHPSPKSPAQ